MNKGADNIHGAPMPRRRFLKSVWIAIISISIIEVGFVVIAFLTSGGRKSRSLATTEYKVMGKVSDFVPGSVTAFRSDRLYMVRMEDGGFLAVSLHCTHLGCAITWNKDSNEFDCPCHASSFNKRGEVISPPAPRALDLYPVKIEGGLIKVDKHNAVKRNKFDKSQLIYA